MPPLLALLLTVGFCFFVLRRFARDPSAKGGALWLPVIWIFFIASRFPGQWLALFGILGGGGGESIEGGSPLDAVFFLVLIMAGIGALIQRQLRLSSLIRENIWLALFFGYCFLAIFWSDFPFVAFKRWIKTVGHPVMALIILSDLRPILAFRLVMKRAAFIMLPFSILYIKYFPQYGRGFDSWTGASTYRGITLSKNDLGYGCLIFGMFFIWNLLIARQIEDRTARRREQFVSAIFLAMVFWLLQMSHSATSFATLTLGSAVTIGLGFRWVSKRFFGTYVVAAIILAVVAESSFGVYKLTIEALGRDPSLTDRTKIWADALALDDSPILGAGFESFWLGPRLEIMWAKWWWQPNQAHNGYIETYLNLGAVGAFLLLCLIIATFRKITARFNDDFQFARLRMAFLFVILAYNYTEATFKAVHFVWTIFYIIALDVPRIYSPPHDSESPETL